MSEPRESDLQDTHVNRRVFLGRAAAVFIGLTAACSGAVAAVYLAGPSLKGATGSSTGDGAWVPVTDAPGRPSGDPIRYPVTVESAEGWVVAQATQAVFVDMAADGAPLVFSARCPHEGCQVDWQPVQKTYVCLCHNSEFSRDGSLTKGPAKRGLDPLEARVDADGNVEVKYRLFALDTPERVVIG